MMSPILLATSLAFITSGVVAKNNCESKLEICWARGPMKPVCGTDNKTYPTRCHLLKARCSAQQSLPNQQQPLAVSYKGQCRESKRSCWTDERRSGSDVGGSAVYTPKCLPDGSYAPVQCHTGIGFCWCVTPAGKPINHSYVRGKTPQCNRKGKTKGGQNRGRKKRKDCGRIERGKFMNNLVTMFNMEYAKSSKHASDGGDSVGWKFEILDVDKNGTLTVEEYRSLRRLVKRTVRPKKCARSWVRACDKDRDRAIDRQEWTNCLAKHNYRFPGALPIIPRKRKKEESSEKEEESEVYDCLTDRKSVLEEQKLGNQDMYIPECTPDGRYQKIQCYKSIGSLTGYCWCVYEDTGKPIPGTSIKDNKPNCDVVHTTPRVMKGCPEHRKQVFLKDLMEFLMKTMEEQKARADSFTFLQSQNKDETVAMWNFIALDMNKNKVLERKEWKSFRTLISADERLKQCGKKMPRYCDVNRDRKISLTEWLNCLDTRKASADLTSASNYWRLGFGPLEILKEYD